MERSRDKSQWSRSTPRWLPLQGDARVFCHCRYKRMRKTAGRLGRRWYPGLSSSACNQLLQSALGWGCSSAACGGGHRSCLRLRPRLPRGLLSAMRGEHRVARRRMLETVRNEKTGTAVKCMIQAGCCNTSL
eukprot:6193004-Pleurochrysis_carterae.AAC.8